MDIKVKDEDKAKIIKYIKDKVNTLQNGERVKLPNSILIESFFEGKRVLYQTRIENFFDKIDITDFIKEYSSAIQILIGANCEESNIDYAIINKIFLTASSYSTNNLKKTNIGRYINTDNIPNINLSNNDFNGYEWQLDAFLIEVRKYVKDYILHEYRYEIDQINEEMEWAFNQYGDATIGDDGSLDKFMKRDIKIIMQKIIPNLKNTKLRINFDLSKLCYEDRDFLEEFLLSDRFDGCYINSSKELYDHNKTIQEKQKQITKKQNQIAEIERQYDCYINTMLEQVDIAFSKKIKCKKI